MKLAQQQKVMSSGFQWDFTVDGGAVGTMDTGLFFPAFTEVFALTFHCFSALVSADPASTISVATQFGATLLSPAILSSTLVPGTKGSFGNITGVVMGIGNITTQSIVNPDQILFNIGGASGLTAGRLSVILWYSVYPNFN